MDNAKAKMTIAALPSTEAIAFKDLTPGWYLDAEDALYCKHPAVAKRSPPCIFEGKQDWGAPIPPFRPAKVAIHVTAGAPLLKEGG